MGRTFAIEVLTPERTVVRAQAEYASLPTVDGLYGVLGDHAPMVGLLRPGVLHYRSGGETGVVAVMGGFFEVLPNRTVVLADEAELPEEVDVSAALAERDRALAAIEAGGEQQEVQRAREALERAMARLRAAGRT